MIIGETTNISKLVKRRAREIFDERLYITNMDAELRMALFDASHAIGILAVWPDGAYHSIVSDISPNDVTDAELNDKIAAIIHGLEIWRKVRTDWFEKNK